MVVGKGGRQAGMGTSEPRGRIEGSLDEQPGSNGWAGTVNHKTPKITRLVTDQAEHKIKYAFNFWTDRNFIRLKHPNITGLACKCQLLRISMRLELSSCVAGIYVRVFP